ncbi:flagellar basal body rod protein FlgB [Paenibacillus sp. SC116]|uniref:Flagellar basal body rod protein FlgB n=1 Tax=Paenibacillus agilis TaxID=3020863 RepID=A0A559J277_9BACL|nr:MULTISPECIES: flagellar basal body rod protein FlgB [Paenibacillus]MCR8845442.1 flagellar basal body rod protein FlgB [Paenibacillus sp. SC116]TVX93985.1 flagellar basal body rod protein FlgB [Paenibacillus agilis]
MNLMGGSHVQRLEGAIQASVLRQNVIANNIANADTPHFKRSEVQFESLLRDQLSSNKLRGRRTHEKHMYIGPRSGVPQASLIQDKQSVMGNNKNNVDMEHEMTVQAENQLRYYTYVQQLNHHINMMKTAIDARR